MRLIQTNKVTDWRSTFEDSVQVAYAPIPTGETYEHINEEGQKSKKMRTVDRAAFGFQTETGRGKGIQWIPVEDVSPALEALQGYAENGVESVTLNDEWLSPTESIHETITRTPRQDSEGNKVDGAWDISFRVRMGKGSKSCRVPEEDFADFVQSLTETSGAIPAALKQVEAARTKAAAKREVDDGDSADDSSDDSDE
jgi:hypothetical protein